MKLTPEQWMKAMETPEMKLALKHFVWRHNQRIRRDAGADWFAFAFVLGLPPLVGGVIGYTLCLWIHS